MGASPQTPNRRDSGPQGQELGDVMSVATREPDGERSSVTVHNHLVFGAGASSACAAAAAAPADPPAAVRTTARREGRSRPVPLPWPPSRSSDCTPPPAVGRPPDGATGSVASRVNGPTSPRGRTVNPLDGGDLQRARLSTGLTRRKPERRMRRGARPIRPCSSLNSAYTPLNGRRR